jgi:chromosomal replication initiator protein
MRLVSNRFLITPENRRAFAAIKDVLSRLTGESTPPLPIPVYVHGPSGCGKTHLLRTLTDELANHRICYLSANDFAAQADLAPAADADLLIVEDLQHLPTRFVASLIALIDTRLRHDGPMIFTAITGPANLEHRGKPMPMRLTSRLAAGLVVGIEPMQRASRHRLLEALATDMQLTTNAEVLDWLAEHLTGGGRQLTGAIRQLKALQRLQAKPLRLVEVRAHFRVQLASQKPSVQRIAEQVSDHYQVPAKQVQSARRSRAVLLPRQVSMYLARQLTTLSFEKIGKYFGGRDHKTVQHACRRIESAMKADAALSGAVRQLQAALA